MGPPCIVRVGTWNTNWAKHDCPRGQSIRKILKDSKCDVLCVTEGFEGILPNAENVIKAPQDWGYSVKDDRRKVLLWSKRPWAEIDVIGSERLPGGRFIRASTKTDAGTILTVVGACIPWRGSNVKGGRMDRKPWQDHRAWLKEFGRLRSTLPTTPLVVLGDFNQKIPQPWKPRAGSLSKALQEALAGLEIATAGNLRGAPRPTIDHIAHSGDLTPLGVKVWLDHDADGMYLSDHLGTRGRFSLS